jgi:hypothetical protein
MQGGHEKGMHEQHQAIARNLLDVLDDETISERTGLSLDAVRHLRQESG